MRLIQRSAAGLALTLPLLLAGACGDDDSASSGGDEPASCTDRFVDFVSSEELADAAEAGGAMPDGVQKEFDAIEDDCGDELDELSDDDIGALIGDVPVKVLQYLGESAEEEFQETGSAIDG